MRMSWIMIGASVLLGALAAAPAGAQTLGDKALERLAAERGAMLRFRQLEGATTLGKGHVDLTLQYDGAPIDNSSGTPRIVGRFGVSHRVDIGAWGGYENAADYGMAGVDVKIALLREGHGSPVSVAIRPSFSSIVASGPWVGNAGVDVSISRTFARFTPYGGVAATSSLALERVSRVDLTRATSEEALSYAGLTYRWQALLLSGEVQHGSRVSYAIRVGTRF